MPLGDDDYIYDQHVCTWLQRPLEADFGNKEIVLTKFGHLECLDTHAPGVDSTPMPEVQRWECRLWTADDEPEMTTPSAADDDGEHNFNGVDGGVVSPSRDSSVPKLAAADDDGVGV